MSRRNLMLFIVIYSICVNGLYSQNIKERSDTLHHITVIADTSFVRAAGVVNVDMSKMQHMVTALGEGDVIKYIQTMPGISAGVEGSSSFYVRGGNLGNNVITIDGVRLYGYGHLLGITSAFSNDIVGSADFKVGGFGAESYNMLASHIDISTKNPNFQKAEASLGASNFMLGGYVATPVVKDVLAVEIAARISPLSFEYEMGRKWLDEKMEFFTNLDAKVYDAYGKISYKPNKNHIINASVFYSKDNFGYGKIEESSYDNMNWYNMLGNLEWKFIVSPKLDVKTNVSYNNYESCQMQERILLDAYNRLTISSSIKEVSINTVFNCVMSDRWNMKFGIRGTKSMFNPGSSKEYNDSDYTLLDFSSENLLGNFYTELGYMKQGRLMLQLALRGNYFIGKKGKFDEFKVFDPEVSFNGSARITDWMGVEVTFDQLVQYYHTLEGIPLGWSLDMIVPSSKDMQPEKGRQYYGGLLFKASNEHRFSVGAYYKKLDNLIYFEKASDFFGQSLAAWKEFVQIGEGESKGVEFLYRKSGERLNCKIAYTFSKSTRFFPEMNDGRVFRAKFDRPHILNAAADYIIFSSDTKKYGATLQMSYQSGNMETVQSGTYPGIIPGYEVEFKYYSSFNNFRLEDYIRADIGVYAKWKRDRVTHNLKLGIYNITNRHNIFSLYYDSDDSTWKKVYVFPIMPSISYRVEL